MRIGVTGIYASGKGTVCNMFEKLGAIIIDTDIIAREIVEPGKKGLIEIVSKFGDKYLNKDGTLKRREFANFIFSDKSRVEQLNNITHPLILEKTLSLAPDLSKKIYMINTPLLFEANFDKYMDKNIVVSAKIDQIYTRGEKRDKISKTEIESRLNHQISLEEKIKKADYIVDNSSTIEKTKKQVLKIWSLLKN